MNLLKKQDNSFFITNPKAFKGNVIKDEYLQKAFEFAYNMTFGESGEHRSNRSGGQHRRKNGELFINTFQGKIAEFMVYDFLKLKGLILNEPDLETWDLGAWDDTDLIVNNKKINIKSTTFFGNLLLLETKDWNSNAEYIPNFTNDNQSYYDYFIFCRIKPDGKRTMSSQRLFYTDTVEKQVLENLILTKKWEAEITGFLENEDLKYIINNGFVLPQNSLLNGKTKMDAENYYCQSGDFKSIDKIINELTVNKISL